MGKKQLNLKKKDPDFDELPDEAFFTVNAGTFAKFLAMLDQPLPPTDKLRRLLKTKAPWEAGK